MNAFEEFIVLTLLEHCTFQVFVRLADNRFSRHEGVFTLAILLRGDGGDLSLTLRVTVFPIVVVCVFAEQSFATFSKRSIQEDRLPRIVNIIRNTTFL